MVLPRALAQHRAQPRADVQRDETDHEEQDAKAQGPHQRDCSRAGQAR